MSIKNYSPGAGMQNRKLSFQTRVAIFLILFAMRFNKIPVLHAREASKNEEMYVTAVI